MGVLILSMGLFEVGLVDRLTGLYADAGIATVGAVSAVGSAVLNNHPMSHQHDGPCGNVRRDKGRSRRAYRRRLGTAAVANGFSRRAPVARDAKASRNRNRAPAVRQDRRHRHGSDPRYLARDLGAVLGRVSRANQQGRIAGLASAP